MRLFNYARILIGTFMFALLSIQVSWAAEASFSWLANNDSGITAGYMLHYGTSSREYTDSIDVGSPTPTNGRIYASVDQLEAGKTYFFTVTAYNSAGSQSSYPSEVICSIPYDAVSSSDDYEILATTSSSLAGAVALDGTTVEGEIYIFTGPDTGVSSVVFSVDGIVARTEGLAPFELAGGATYDTSDLSPGNHEVNADIKLSDGSSKFINAVFTIPSADEDPVDNNIHDIYLSKASNLSEAAILDGVTVEDNIYVFTSPDTGVSSVTFSVDGVVTRKEGIAPFELVGGTAFDTTQLSPGEHEITASIELSDNSIEIITAIFTVPSSNEDVTNDSLYSLFVSNSSNLLAATDLDGASVNEDIYVFTGPDTGVSSVTFAVDGIDTRKEGIAPFELAGGSAFDTSDMLPGVHEITAKIELNDGSLEVVSAVFTIPGAEAVADDSPYSLLFSESSYLSAATDLDGAAVNGDIYVFTGPDTNVSSVTFSVDGVFTQKEGLAPFELVGGAAFNTSQLSSGKHEITALIKLDDGSLKEINTTFTVM
jgi:hypothetical protein